MIEIEECGLFLGSSNLAWKWFRGGLNLAAWRGRVGVIGRAWGWLNRGLVRHHGESGAAVNEGVNGKMPSIFHPRHFHMDSGIFGSFEPVESRQMAKLLSVLSVGFCLGWGGNTKVLRACLMLFCFLWGDSNTWSHNDSDFCTLIFCSVKLSTLLLVCLVLCNVCVVCKWIWLKQCQTDLHLRKVNISLGSSDILCSLCAELISSASSCSVHMAIVSKWLAERALLFHWTRWKFLCLTKCVSEM